jgi:tetratricopeptide (TPR) repeat protein
MATSGGWEGQTGRLKSWKEIAAFFGTDQRTVKRWESYRGLPVQRIPGRSGGTVFADVVDLHRWLSGDPAPKKQRRTPWIAAAFLALAAGGLALWAGLPGAEPSAHRPRQEVADLYLTGTYNLERRTPESLRRAEQLFAAAVDRDPAYAEPSAGLANTYLLLREYAGLADAEAYPRAKRAAERALKLNPALADARLALAFVTFYWERDFAGGLVQFESAVRLSPDSSRARHWHATALYHAGRIDAALTQINEAQRLDPGSQAILADKGLLLFHSNRVDESIALLRQIESADPAFLSPHSYLAIIHLARGDVTGWLAQARLAARMLDDAQQNAILDSADRGWRQGGRRAMLAAMLATQQRLDAGGSPSMTYEIAATHALMGSAPEAIRYLELAWRRRDPGIPGMRMDPRFRSLHEDPAFRAIAARLG